MFKGFLLGVLLTIVAAGVAAYLVVSTGTIPAAAASGQPLPFEHWAARMSLRSTLKAEAPKEPNPVPLNDANLIAGIGLYGKHCAICHGNAQGDKAPSPIAKGEYPRPPQFASEGVEDDPQGWTFWKIENGIRWTGMPSWRDTLTPTQAWAIALFLKHMDKLTPAAQQAWQQVQ